MEQKEFSPLSVDGTASKNGVGYFRLPRTFNSKAKKLVTVELNEDKPVYVLQDLMEKMEEFRQEESEVLRAQEDGLTGEGEKADTVTQGMIPLSAINLEQNKVLGHLNLVQKCGLAKGIGRKRKETSVVVGGILKRR